jgi:hypothetical protein
MLDWRCTGLSSEPEPCPYLRSNHALTAGQYLLLPHTSCFFGKVGSIRSSMWIAARAIGEGVPKRRIISASETQSLSFSRSSVPGEGVVMRQPHHVVAAG